MSGTADRATTSEDVMRGVTSGASWVPLIDTHEMWLLGRTVSPLVILADRSSRSAAP